MDSRNTLATKLTLAGFAVAALVATALLFGGIDVLAEHYASGHDSVQVAAPAV